MAKGDMVRVAHWTDIHVADNWEAWKKAFANVGIGLVVTSSLMAGIELILHLLDDTRWKDRRVPIHMAVTISARIVLLSTMALDPRLRRRLLFLRDVFLLIHQSSPLRRRALFEDLKGRKVDHLLITGDISVCSRQEEFKTFAAELRAHGFEAGSNLTLLPGNHDRLQFLGQPEFENFFPGEFPVIRELRPGVVLFGLDSTMNPHPRNMWQKIWENVFTNMRGTVHPEQSEKVTQQMAALKDETLIVGMHHPPFDYRPHAGSIRKALRPTFKEPMGADVLKGALTGARSIILCGHRHPTTPRDFEQTGLSAVMGTPSGMITRKVEGKRHMSYRIFNFVPKGLWQTEDILVPVPLRSSSSS